MDQIAETYPPTNFEMLSKVSGSVQCFNCHGWFKTVEAWENHLVPPNLQTYWRGRVCLAPS